MIRAVLVPIVIGLVLLFMVLMAMGSRAGSIEILIVLAILVPGVALAIRHRVRSVRKDEVSPRVIALRRSHGPVEL